MSIKKNIKDLDFPLVREFRKAPKTDIAKQKLLTGRAVFRIDSNKCNHIEFLNNEWNLCVPAYNTGTHSLTLSYIPLRDLYIGLYASLDFKRLSGDLYSVEWKSTYAIIRNNTILCIFRIHSLFNLDSYAVSGNDIIVFSSKVKSLKFTISQDMIIKGEY